MHKKVIPRLFTAIMTLALLASVSMPAHATGGIIQVSGEIQGNTTWTADNQYVIAGDTYVRPGVTLTIEAGVIVKIKPGVRFLVDGSLNASGTDGNEIYFTDFRDDTVGGDTNGDGNASSPAAGGWTYMLLGYNNDASANFSHCVLRYGGGNWGGWGNDSLIVINRVTNVSIDNCELANSALRGIRIEGATGTVSISNSSLHDNINNGLLSKNSTPVITNNVFSGNGQYGIYVQGAALPSSISGNSFSSNVRGSIGLGTAAAGTSIASDNSSVEGIWLDSGEISSSAVLDAAFPYVITGDTYVRPGVTLTIEAGVIVKIKPGVRFLVDGSLDASGTDGNEIYFTDFRDDTVGGDTNGDGNASSPTAGGWTYMLLGYNNDASANFSHCVLRYGGGNWGGWGNDSLIVINRISNVSIDNCELANSALRGIRIEGASGTVSISNSSLHDNAQYGLYINNTTGNVGINKCQINNCLLGQIGINNSPNVTISETPAETLIASASPGTVDGSTKLAATVGSGNHLVVQISSSAISDVDLYSLVPTGAGVIDPYTSGTNISAVDSTTNKYLAVYEANTNKVVKYKLISITDNDIYTAPVLKNAATSVDGTKLTLSFDKAIANPSGKHAQFTVVSGGSANAVTAAALGADAKTIELTLTTPVEYGQIVKLSYTPGTVAAADGGMLAAFTEQAVTNNVPANEAQIGSISYQTLGAALAAATGTDTICLLADITVSNAIKAESKNITIDLNGFDLSVSGVGEHALQATSGHLLSITDANQYGGRALISSSGPNKYAAYAASGGDIIIEGTLSATYPGGLDNQGIIGAYASGDGSTIQVTGSISGYSEGIHAVNSASIKVIGTISGSYYGAYVAYKGSADISGNVNASRALVVEYAGTAEVDGNITGSSYAVEGTTVSGWDPPLIRITGNVIGTAGAAISASNAADIQITGDVSGYIAVSGSSFACPVLTLNGNITVSSGFGISVFYGGTVTVNGRIVGASPYLKLNNLDISQADYEISDNYFKYSNQTAETPAPFAANTVYVTKVNQPPVITSDWNYASVYFGKDYAYSLKVTDTDNTAGTKIYSSLDGAPYSIAWIYPGAPGEQNMMLSPLKTVLAAGSHSLRYYAEDSGGAVSNTLTLNFTVSDEPSIPPTDIPTDTGTTVTLSTTDGQVSVTAALIQTNGEAHVVVRNDDFKRVNNANKAVSVNARLATLSFDQKAVDTIGTVAGSDDVKLTVRQVPATELSAAQKAAVGSRPVYDFSVTGGGKTISDFEGGHATVSIPYTLTAGEQPNSIVIWYLSDSGKLLSVRGHYDASAKAVVFSTPHFSIFVIGYKPISFKDVTAGAWYEDAVSFLAARDITTGTGSGNFSPDTALTRGQFVVMLMRAYGIEANDNFTDNFADAGNSYYTNYLAAAKRLGISVGIGNNLFAPDKHISRQEMFTLLYNALTVIAELPEGNSGKKLSDFSDASDIASWAKNAMTILVESGAISGRDGKLAPTDSTSRSEMAELLYNLLLK